LVASTDTKYNSSVDVSLQGSEENAAPSRRTLVDSGAVSRRGWVGCVIWQQQQQQQQHLRGRLLPSVLQTRDARLSRT